VSRSNARAPHQSGRLPPSPLLGEGLVEHYGEPHPALIELGADNRNIPLGTSRVGLLTSLGLFCVFFRLAFIALPPEQPTGSNREVGRRCYVGNYPKTKGEWASLGSQTEAQRSGLCVLCGSRGEPGLPRCFQQVYHQVLQRVRRRIRSSAGLRDDVSDGRNREPVSHPGSS
jgi:hypothetical protein